MSSGRRELKGSLWATDINNLKPVMEGDSFAYIDMKYVGNCLTYMDSFYSFYMGVERDLSLALGHWQHQQRLQMREYPSLRRRH